MTLAQQFANATEDMRKEAFLKMKESAMAVSAKELGISIEKLDGYAKEAGLRGVWMPYADMAGQTDYERAVAGDKFVSRHVDRALRA